MTYGGKEAGEMYGGILQEPTPAWLIIMRAAEVKSGDERRWRPITTGATELRGQEMIDYIDLASARTQICVLTVCQQQHWQVLEHCANSRIRVGVGPKSVLTSLTADLVCHR